MKRFPIVILISTVLISTFAFQSCRLSDISTSVTHGPDQSALEIKGKELMAQAAEVHGVDLFSAHNTYEVIGKDHWKGLLGSVGNPWPENNVTMALRYVTGTFDGQMEYLEGDLLGHQYGLQSWNYYEKDPNSDVNFEGKEDKNIRFVIPAFHYFFEIVSRLNDAPFIRYAGTESWNGIQYELVFVSWESAAPHPDLDQYLVYIHPESRRVEGVKYTIREATLPGSKGIYATIAYSDYQNIDGALIPFKQTIFNGDFGDADAYLHELTVESFTFDAVEVSALRPNAALSVVGDEKP